MSIILAAVASIYGIVTLSHLSNTTRAIKLQELIFQSEKNILSNWAGVELQIWRFEKIMLINNIYVCISPANKSLFVSALCSALCQVPDRHRADPAGLLLQGEVGVRDLQ